MIDLFLVILVAVVLFGIAIGGAALALMPKDKE